MKSYVSLDTKICPICTKQHEVGVILNKRLKDSLEKNTVTGWGLCPDCVEKKNDNYVALVGCDPDKSEKKPNGNIDLSGAYRTGKIAWLRKPVAEDMFSGVINSDMLFATDDLFVELERMQKEIES
jgi:hypothetical protein